MSFIFPRKTLAIVAVLISILSVQAGAAFSKHLFPVIGAEGTTALRQVFATLILLLLFRPWRGAPDRGHLRLLALYGGLLGVMNLSFYLGIARIPLGVGVAIEFLGPLSVAIFTSRRWSDALWVACAIAGLAILLLAKGDLAGRLDPIGCLWCLIAAVCWGSYIIVGQKVSGQVEGGKAVAIGMAISTLFTLPVGMAFAGPALWSPAILPWGLAVGILSSAIPYTLEMLALKHIPAKTFSLMMSLEPAAAALLAFVILGERLTAWQWLAVGLVILASAGSSLTARQGVSATA
jgi:inner membrane transporter RhtA